ncbi:hypothetical protein GCM10022243_13680 [Saccharothrix violaceirubra]|uniref:Glutamine cyclotransferase n=1 Tax=Saccharothrix violaceirubra TaxID=413306 RepID=A0A7W7WU97_9PSEU|nr:glutaminyl-peptide cyclotransferase [Saccharothrix violaceirubra]MBB4963512.1 hypothetical protein [Saccharothrix violaceirubra]
MKSTVNVVVSVGVLVLVVSCGTPERTGTALPVSVSTRVSAAAVGPVSVRTVVVEAVPSDGADVRGLGVVGDFLVEAVETGAGAVVRVVDAAGTVVRGVDVARAGAVAGVHGGLWQLDSAGRAAIARDPETLVETRRVGVDDARGGLCFTGRHLVHASTADRLVLRDPVTFDEVGAVVLGGHWSAGRLVASVACAGSRAWVLLAGSDWVVEVDLDRSAVVAVASLTRVRADDPEVAGVFGAITAVGDGLWVAGSFRHRFRVRLEGGR